MYENDAIMSQLITIFRGTSGLNTVADPARIPISRDGINDVAESVNITIDQYGRPSCRKGFGLLMEGDFHSIFRNGGDCFVVQDHPEYGGSAILRITKTAPGVYATSGIRSSLTLGAKMSWLQIGNRTYYANGFQSGYIVDGGLCSWVVGEYRHGDTDRVFSIPERPVHLAEHSGRIYVSEDNVVYWSELFEHDLFWQKQNFIMFNTKVRMIRPVSGGLYIGDEQATYYISGNEPSGFNMVQVSTFPPVEWSDASELMEGVEIGFQEPGLCATWASREGVMVGLPGGAIVNRNKKKVIYPENVSAGFGCMVGYHYVHGVK